MATIIICDRCGKGIPNYPESNVMFPFYHIVKHININNGLTIDLCNKCNKEFEEFLNEKKEV